MRNATMTSKLTSEEMLSKLLKYSANMLRRTLINLKLMWNECFINTESAYEQALRLKAKFNRLQRRWARLIKLIGISLRRYSDVKLSMN
ncbi:MAG: hypothetical protein ACTS42_00975 [Candidatus Hodgkinia cicadicola]